MSETLIINGRFLTQKLTGVHRYAFEMCSALQNLGCDFIILAPNNTLSDYKHSFNVLKIGKLSSHLWEQIELPIYINIHYKNSILINFTGLGSIFQRRSICTIHDLSYLENPAWFTKSYYYLYKFLTPIVAKKALKIITVSEFSKKEIVSKLNIHESKVEVISNAVSEKLINKKDEISDTSKYLLSVSSIDPRKNQIRLIEAFNLLPYKDLKLYIVGKKNKVFGKHSIVNETNPNIIFTGYLTDLELFNYYRHATAFIYPSLYEGFGIPNLEAMINDCPVITSAIPPHLEICQNAALYFDPYNPVDIAEKIKTILKNDAIRHDLIANGRLCVSEFTWQKSAQKLLNILKEVR